MSHTITYEADVETHAAHHEEVSWLDRLVLGITREQALYLVFIVLAIVSRLVMIGARVQSHDESLHTSYSWDLYDGRGYQHNPMTHGPFLYHATALSYWLFGDSDATARIPVAILGVLLVAFPYMLRKHLGRWGALAASFLFLISPSILFYSRYIRHDIPIILWSLIVAWSTWSYLRTRESKYLYWFAAGVSLMFATKEVAFLYVAIFGSFLAVRLAVGLLTSEWRRPAMRGWFQIGLIALAVGALIFGVAMVGESSATKQAIEAAAEAGTTLPEDANPAQGWKLVQVGSGVVVGASLAVAIYAAIRGMKSGRLLGPGRNRLRDYPETDLVVLYATLLLPFMGALPVSWLATRLGVEVTWSSMQLSPQLVYLAAGVMVVLIGLSIAAGALWDWRRWLVAAGIFYAIFIVSYTTVFTNSRGFATGWLGSLGYWLEQQGVERGSQPWYFYFWVVPIYEFLPLLGAIAAGLLWAFRDGGLKLLSRLFSSGSEFSDDDRQRLFGFIPFVVWWSVLTWLVYSYAGEKMGWLTTHFAVPMILLAGWFLGRVFTSIDWQGAWKRGGWALVVLLPVLIVALYFGVVEPLLFDGGAQLGDQLLDNMIATGRILSGILVAAGAGVAIYLATKQLQRREAGRFSLVIAFGLLGIMTARAAWMASYINYDTAKEYIVYAHGGPGTKEVMAQIEDISQRLYGDLSIKVSFDDDVAWPYWWYLRDYPNKNYFGANPSRDSMDTPIALVGDKNWSKVDPYAGDRFYTFDYIFVQWPMEDYKHMTWERIKNAITNPAMRGALWDIVLNRDYQKYAQLVEKDFSLGNWPLRHKMRLYVRKDIAAQLWDYGIGPAVAEASVTDPYAASFQADLKPIQVFGTAGSEQGQLMSPRGIAVGSDGLIYVVDWGNSRIQVFDADGQFVRTWGTPCSLETGAGCVDPDGSGPQPLGAGQFREPWGIAVADDGTVYVADTWNHRIQHFTADGEFLNSWGTFGQPAPGQPAGQLRFFYGPRDIAIGPEGMLYVTDTGNKVVQVFRPDGSYVGEFGEPGALEGQLNEPVGLDFGPDGLLYVADTWNGEVDVFDQSHSFVRSWTVDAWYGQLPDNKPYLATDALGQIYLTDPEQYRVLVFDAIGNYLYGFGQYGTEPDAMTLPTGIDVGPNGAIYVSDAGNSRILVFSPPQ
jgi:predicted membrane-bound mannosyltransferase/DNA-binding beta-propeller fold protein YncE